MTDKKTPFARFVSSVEGHIVSRYPSSDPIGVRVVPGKEIVWMPDVVVALTAEETAQYRREYDQHVRDKALVERTEAEYLAFVDDQTKNDPGPPQPEEPAPDGASEQE